MRSIDVKSEVEYGVEALISRDSRVSARDSFYRQVLSNTTHDMFCQSYSGVKYPKNGVVEWTRLLFG